MSVTNTEWDDIPTSSELFGGDFFGDELMEMYTADHGLNLGGASSAIISTSSSGGGGGHPDQDDESNHPGVLIAMNAAAMDGGLSPLGSTPEFVPHMALSDGSSKLPAYPTLTKAKKKKTKGGAASSSAEPTVASSSSVVVATAAAVAATSNTKGGKDLSNVSQGVVTRKRKGAASQAPTATKKAAVVTRKAAANMAAAATTTKKVVAPSAPKVSTRSSAAASQVSKTASGKASTVLPTPAATIAKTGGVRAPASVLKKQPAAATAAVPFAVSSAGGITHQVARPSAVPSSTVGTSTTQRIAPPATTTTTSRPTGYARTTVPVSSTGVKRAHSEADFKDVASAAVTSLIQNVSSTTGPKPIPKVGEKPVDVSTAHINALTSQNWVTACNPIPTPIVSAADAAEKAARNARRATLTQEERAKQNRDRNREHARNTRLRKKAYVEELKRTLTELVARRDAADLEKRHEAQRNREQREVRFRVMEEFLKLRGRNELIDARWVAILEDGFVLTLPKTSFRKMVDVDTKASSSSSSKDNDGENDSSDTTHSSLQALRGAAQVMEDSAHLSAYLQTIGGSVSTEPGDAKIELTYKCDRKHFFMDGNIAFMDFTATTVGVVAKGASSEVVYKGQIRSSFSPASNKLISVDCTFDTASFIQQVEALSHASSSKAAAAAHEADALLDSLQMPHFADKKEDEKAAISVSSDDGEIS